MKLPTPNISALPLQQSLWLFFGLATFCVLTSYAPAAVVITTQEHLAVLNQSATDAINGLTPTVSANFILTGGGNISPSLLSNATSTTGPTTSGLFYNGGDGVKVTYDLGTAVAAADRQLDGFSIWLANIDSQRNGFDGYLSVSLDGVNFTQIAGTAFSFNPSYAAANNGTFNQVLYTFSAGDVTNFRYIQLTTNNEASGNQPRFIELDAFVTVVPEPGVIGLLLGGSCLVLLMKRRRMGWR